MGSEIGLGFGGFGCVEREVEFVRCKGKRGRGGLERSSRNAMVRMIVDWGKYGGITF